MDKVKAVKFVATFLGGVVFGSAGFKALSSREAKHAYAGAAATGLRVKDYVMNTVEKIQASADDVLAEAKVINEKKDMEEANACESVSGCTQEDASEE